MPIEKIDAMNDWTYVRGVVDANTVHPLGPTSNAFSLTDRRGTHYGAVYQPKPSTTLLRLYFDPKGGFSDDLGYVQFCQLTSFGRPIPPDVIPALKSRRFYRSTD